MPLPHPHVAFAKPVWPFGYLSCIGPAENGTFGMSRGMPVIVVAPVSAFTETTEMLSNRIESRPSPLSAPSNRML